MRMSAFGILIGLLALIYGGLWWYGKSTHPIQYGISFSSQHAAWLLSDWKQVYQEMLSDLKPPFIRLSVDWDQVEKKEGTYDFSDIDFMMNEAGKQNVRVLLAFGQKTPRWPECHLPSWIEEKTRDEYLDKLYAYVSTTVSRYKDHKALEYWQVENEPYIKFDFGSCERFIIDAIDQEISIVRSKDDMHNIVVTDSGELSVWYPAAKKGDIFGSTMYRIVTTPKGNVFTYDWMPAGWFKARAQVYGLSSSTFFISELQAEPWLHTGDVSSTPIETQFETMSTVQMKKNLEFARHTGASRAYLWGVEWWYWIKYTHNDSRFIDLAREYISKAK
ncbi:MAG TPA: beta-galactosidase [Candidatus Magasanikbacteria bacterium]|nr:beta-galactosidase [Candidatus Magasanikbacteria bacterium]